MKFNEDSRVKIPAILHLTRLGYTYLSLKDLEWDTSSNIVPSFFRSSVAAINPTATATEIENALRQLDLALDNEDLGKVFFEKITATSGLKLAGHPYRASGGPMIYNETLKRDVPEGWDVCAVGEVLAKELRTKNLLSSEIADQGRIPVVDQGSAFICGFTDDEECVINDTPKIVFGDHTRILKFIDFPFARGADGTQILTSRESRLPQHLFYYQLLSVDLSNYGYARHFKFLKDQTMILPNQDAANAFEQIAASIYAKIKNNILQNQELTQLRDWLLPMLMNGQVTVG